MVSLKKYNVSGSEVSEEVIDDSLLSDAANMQMMKDYIVAIRANKRQWSANTKTRSEINCTKKKPHPQKGTGRARQGFLASPQFRGGGIVFGPKPKFNQHVKINRKERRKTIHFLLSQLLKDQKICLVDTKGMETPKTKQAVSLLDTIGIRGKKLLVLGAQKQESQQIETKSFVKSMRNIPKTRFMPALSVSGYDLLQSEQLIILDEAFDEFKTFFEK